MVFHCESECFLKTILIINLCAIGFFFSASRVVEQDIEFMVMDSNDGMFIFFHFVCNKLDYLVKYWNCSLVILHSKNEIIHFFINIFIPYLKKLMLLALKASIFHAFFSAMKVKCFQPNFAIFFMLFFTSIENATKSKFRQEMLNILSVIKFTGSHLAFYE